MVLFLVERKNERTERTNEWTNEQMNELMPRRGDYNEESHCTDDVAAVRLRYAKLPNVQTVNYGSGSLII